MAQWYTEEMANPMTASVTPEREEIRGFVDPGRGPMQEPQNQSREQSFLMCNVLRHGSRH
jgi:hypothetical protein